MDQTPVSFEDFINELQGSYEQSQAELREIGVLINQSMAEVERLTQRNAQAMSHVKQLQLDTVPREDIRSGYSDLVNIQQRLFTMRGQLEKLQSDQRNLERLADLQFNLLQYSGAGDLVQPGEVAGMGIDRTGVVRVIQSEEITRRSLVRQMHDGPASSLSNFILQAEICERLFDTDPDRARQELHTLKGDATSTFTKVKDFIFDLRPMMLDDLGVVPTLRSYSNSFKDKTGIPLNMSVTGVERRLESHIEVTIFRAVQELVNNARMHGQASSISFQLDISPAQVLVVVEDDGQGFNVEEVFDDAEKRKTIGLPALKERLEMLNGKLDFDSRIGQGTRVEFSIPLDEDIY
ncbi:MAG: sensor histidine kinase [Ardenticatenaceae bacterium]|nr:sensor histidine kinase [Ardenticatenaceae bacterium]